VGSKIDWLTFNSAMLDIVLYLVVDMGVVE